MPAEDERKLFLHPDFNGAALADWKVESIKQSYLPGDPEIFTSDEDGEHYLRYRLPLGNGNTFEVSLPIDQNDYADLLHSGGAAGGSVRIRQSEDGFEFTDKATYVIAYKKFIPENGYLAESEEVHISKAEFDMLFAQGTDPVNKTRYKKTIGNVIWGVDFLKDDKGEVYIKLSEPEAKPGTSLPADIMNHLPAALQGQVIYVAPKNSPDLTNKALSDPIYAKRAYADMLSQYNAEHS